MSDVKKCDRCGNYYKTYKHRTMVFRDQIRIQLDLCPECNEALDKWLDEMRHKEAADDESREI